jgi:hypothetical protein
MKLCRSGMSPEKSVPLAWRERPLHPAQKPAGRKCLLSGNPDISGIQGGFSSTIRSFPNCFCYGS